jgi:hypothetical protein
MKVNAHTTIVGDTVVLVPYRYVCNQFQAFIDHRARAEHVEVRILPRSTLSKPIQAVRLRHLTC